MKKALFLLFFISLLSSAQETDSLKIKLRSFDLVKKDTDRDREIRNAIDNRIIKNASENKDTINMFYRLFVDKQGDIFIANNGINDNGVFNTFEAYFNKNKYRIKPYRDSIVSKRVNHAINGMNRFAKKDSIYKIVPLKAQEKVEEEDVIKFSIIEKVPKYEGCEGDNVALRRCMNLKIRKLVARNFNVDLVNSLDLPTGKNRIFASFTINKKGKVDNISIRAPHPILARDTKRVIKLIPKMKPGEQRGAPVNVRYTLPINFMVEEAIPRPKQRK